MKVVLEPKYVGNNGEKGQRFLLYSRDEYAGDAIVLDKIPLPVKIKIPFEYKKALYFYGLNVSANHRRKGYDSILIKKVKDLAKTLGKPMILLASPLEKDRFSTKTLMRYYSLRGFRKIDSKLENCMVFDPKSEEDREEEK